MIIKHLDGIPKVTPEMAGAQGVSLQWIFNKKDGTEHYAMRLFEVAPGGVIPLHDHPDIEHEMFIVEGEAVVLGTEGPVRVTRHDALFVKPGDRHGFHNDTDKPFKFLCVIPVL